MDTKQTKQGLPKIIGLYMQDVAPAYHDSKTTANVLIDSLISYIDGRIESEYNYAVRRFGRFVQEKKIGEQIGGGQITGKSIIKILDNSDKWQPSADDKNFLSRILRIVQLVEGYSRLSGGSLKNLRKRIILMLKLHKETNDAIDAHKSVHSNIHSIMRCIIDTTANKISESKLSVKPTGARSPADTILLQFKGMIGIYNDIDFKSFDVDDYESEDMFRSLIAIIDAAKNIDIQLSLF